MNSPLYPNRTMKRIELEAGLKAFECSLSGGHWINYDDYRRWLKSRTEENEHTATMVEVTETNQADQRAKICPVSGRLLVRYKVSRDIPFHLDRSSAGIWFDKNEWHILKQYGLHSLLDVLLSAPWQKELRAAEHEERMQKIFLNRIGKSAFEKVNNFKRWLDDQPAKQDIIIYLER